MTITLRPITSENWVTCIELMPTPQQQAIGFVAPNTLSLAQAYAEPWWIPLAIYKDEEMVGLVVYGWWPETAVPSHHEGVNPGVYYILRLMIDGWYQGHGYGRAAMEALLARIAGEDADAVIEVDYDPQNTIAIQLYTRLGFVPTGEIFSGEIRARWKKSHGNVSSYSHGDRVK